ncbi:hypothetical protein SODALDRAFT_362938 [Sodiomyces alkalinus F11]|uniref:Uncharacterized protein n=1 Tax=Sodiomyces alkalinus (strain CBS 110278 / VKM F-3762 / F11) TaxID=1314773 RepID=A0A3N2PNH1_SODAK|nr:hypothetical protein SODALDRAFT_362938 [Sodiomyces alkalinus F11]ROT36077.1 hypothetical protein SODALDRAFT_362938 [Sodiomyces alkalinus F11]
MAGPCLVALRFANKLVSNRPSGSFSGSSSFELQTNPRAAPMFNRDHALLGALVIRRTRCNATLEGRRSKVDGRRSTVRIGKIHRKRQQRETIVGSNEQGMEMDLRIISHHTNPTRWLGIPCRRSSSKILSQKLFTAAVAYIYLYYLVFISCTSGRLSALRRMFPRFTSAHLARSGDGDELHSPVPPSQATRLDSTRLDSNPKGVALGPDLTPSSPTPMLNDEQSCCFSQPVPNNLRTKTNPRPRPVLVPSCIPPNTDAFLTLFRTFVFVRPGADRPQAAPFPQSVRERDRPSQEREGRDWKPSSARSDLKTSVQVELEYLDSSRPDRGHRIIIHSPSPSPRFLSTPPTLSPKLSFGAITRTLRGATDGE